MAYYTIILWEVTLFLFDSTVLTIGCNYHDASRLEFFNGTIDELRISDIGRSQDEIQKMMKEGYTAPVESTGKVTTTWASIKAH